ncbi:MAG TPA: PD-(D/E)XK nuclease family protein [Thermoanaerobaculia bacterium]|jgi:RecB family exonuclease|nr:PD-(D/E)XK nuclease family protein [Thermoanaerobaculia bacterium]
MVSLRIAPYRQIAQEIAARLAASRAGADPIGAWAEEVIIPSRGVAEAITAELVRQMPNGIASLRLHTPEELARRVVVRTPDDLERRLAMRVAVRTIDHPMMESRGVASMLERAYRDVRDSGLTLAELAKRVSTTRGLRNPKRTEAIVGAWREYERLIAQLNAIDAADRLRRVNSDLPMQLLAGFYDMTGAQLALVQSLLDAGRIAAIWVPTEEPFAQPFLTALAPHVTVTPTDNRQPTTDNANQYDSLIDELRDVTARVAALLAQGTPASEIGIVARSLEPYDARLLNRFAEEHGFATTLTDETPLNAHRIGRGAMTLLRLRERGFLRAEVLELLRDGLHVKTQINIDGADSSTRRARVAGGVSEELRKMRTRDPIIADYIAVVAELEALTATIDLDFISRLSTLFRIETDTDLAAAEILDKIAAVFRRTAVWNRGFDVTAVLDAIEHESLNRQPRTDNRQLIWAGDVMRFRGRSFTHLFVVRMQDDVFPQRRTEDPLLPDSDRRLLRLREIGDGREEEQLLFSLLGDASPNVHFSFATGDGFGKVLRKSRYLRNIETVAITLAHPQPATSNQQQRPLQLLAKSGTRSVFDGYIGALSDTLREKLTAVSPTQLEDFGECPQKFLLKHLLGVTELDAPERELQIHHREKGSIDHRILEGFYRHLTAEDLANAAATLPQLPDALGSKLDALIDAQFDAHESVVPPFNRTVRGIERRATKRILREFLASDIADLDAQELVPRWFEYRFGAKSRRIENAPPSDHPDPFLVDAGGVPVRVEGTIDRIDMDRDPTQSRFRIVDYKSGKALRHVNLGDKIDRGVRLQLALYAMAVAEFFEAKPEHVSGTIKPIVVGEAKAAKFAFALHEKRDALVETLEIFVRAILSGKFPAFPNDNDAEFNSCKYCPVNHSCRTRHDLDERYAVQQQKDPRTLLGGRA